MRRYTDLGKEGESNRKCGKKYKIIIPPNQVDSTVNWVKKQLNSPEPPIVAEFAGRGVLSSLVSIEAKLDNLTHRIVARDAATPPHASSSTTSTTTYKRNRVSLFFVRVCVFVFIFHYYFLLYSIFFYSSNQGEKEGRILSKVIIYTTYYVLAFALSSFHISNQKNTHDPKSKKLQKSFLPYDPNIYLPRTPYTCLPQKHVSS